MKVGRGCQFMISYFLPSQMWRFMQITDFSFRLVALTCVQFTAVCCLLLVCRFPPCDCMVCSVSLLFTCVEGRFGIIEVPPCCPFGRFPFLCFRFCCLLFSSSLWVVDNIAESAFVLCLKHSVEFRVRNFGVTVSVFVSSCIFVPVTSALGW